MQLRINSTTIRLVTLALFVCGLTTITTGAAAGDLDMNFGTGGHAFLAANNYTTIRLQLQSDGKIVTISSDYWDDTDSVVCRQNSDGTADSSFAAGGCRILDRTVVFDFIIQPDGKIIAVGDSFAILRLSSDGTPDSGFGTNGVVPFDSSSRTGGTGVALQPDGKIVISAFGDSFAGPRLVIVRYHPDGTPDASFGTNGTVVENTLGVSSEEIIVQSDGKLVVTGWGFIARYDPNGLLDPGFGTNGKVSTGVLDRIASQPDGKILVSLSGTMRRFNSNGTSDTSFGTNGAVVNSFGINAVAVQGNGKILTAGAREGSFAMSRYNPDGTVDTTFGTNGVVIAPLGNSSPSTGIHNLALQPDGKIVAAGFYWGGSYPGYVTLVRYLGDPLNSGSNFSVSGRVTTPGGRGLSNTEVWLTDSLGARRTALTSSFGFYTIDNVQAGGGYVIGVSSKRYRFAPRNLNVIGSLADEDFVGLE